jgi:hypothetical protein
MTIQDCRLFIKIKESVNQILCKEILEVSLSSTICRYGLDSRHLIFQQDIASIYTTKILRDWFRNHFNLLQWLSQLPNLNPIEHLWALAKRQLNQYDSAPSSMLELWDHVKDVWCSIYVEECKQLYESMPRLILVVLASKGR